MRANPSLERTPPRRDLMVGSSAAPLSSRPLCRCQFLMEDIVAVAVELEDGSERFFLTWGRIQDAVKPAPIEQLMLGVSTQFSLGGKPVNARLCPSLQEARDEPYFYESFFGMCQRTIPFGETTYQP
jgi:hypothetical protein